MVRALLLDTPRPPKYQLELRKNNVAMVQIQREVEGQLDLGH